MKRDAKDIERSVNEYKEEKYNQVDRAKATRYLVNAGIVIIAIILLVNTLRAPTWYDTLEDVPDFKKDAYVVIQRNVPDFSEDMLVSTPFFETTPLDELGRPGAVTACIGTETVPEAGKPVPETITPPGWMPASYDSIEGGQLYYRTELIGSQLTGIDPVAENVCTGTALQQTKGLRALEIMVAREMIRANVHVVYRVTPIYEGDNLVPSGFTVEAVSVEDNGQTVRLHLYVYNAQKGITIDYATGQSSLAK